MAEGPGLCTLTDVSPDGRFGLLHRFHYRANSHLYVVELVSGTETLLTAHDGAANFGPSHGLAKTVPRSWLPCGTSLVVVAPTASTPGLRSSPREFAIS